MAQLATAKHWNSRLDKWTLNTGYYDEWGFHTGNIASYGRNINTHIHTHKKKEKKERNSPKWQIGKGYL